MADFDLTQTDAQVQSILNDAQDAMGAGAQTSLTTDYIMLKGTNGRYHKILKDSFTEAVRNTLAGLLVNNDKGTTISQIAAIASGDFGSVTPANLASVLGDTMLGTDVKIAVMRLSGNFPLLVDIKNWSNYSNTSAYTCDGIGLVHSRGIFVIAKDEASSKLSWGNTGDDHASTGAELIAGDGDVALANTRNLALNDFTGYDRMLKINAVSEYQPTTTAPGFCAAYSVGSYSGTAWGVKLRHAGCWRLPTVGELALMYANFAKINHAMSVVGGTALSADTYWSCTEWSASNAWILNLSDGFLGNLNKKNTFGVRPVCAF